MQCLYDCSASAFDAKRKFLSLAFRISSSRCAKPKDHKQYPESSRLSQRLDFQAAATVEDVPMWRKLESRW